MSDWEDELEYQLPPTPDEKIDYNVITYRQKNCWHNWVPILLLNNTVYNCGKCDVHKEVWDKRFLTNYIGR